MFAINMRDADSVGSYPDALAVYNKGKDRGLNERRIPGKENSPTMSMRMIGSSVAFRYHYTDVVVWHEDNTCTLTTFPSVSTCTFANNYLPFRTYLGKTGRVLFAGGVYYAPDMSGSVQITSSGGTVTGDLGCFYKTKINRDRAKAYLAGTPYAAYRDWYNLNRPLFPDDLGRTNLPYRFVDLLADKENWVRLLLGGATPSTVRAALYDAAPVSAGVFDDVYTGTLDKYPTSWTPTSKPYERCI